MGRRILCVCLFVSFLSIAGVSRTDSAQAPASYALPQVAPETIGLRSAQLNRIDAAVAAAIQAGETPAPWSW